ncbi:MAG: ATP synthase subunit C [Aigarchaeota archaeon]|nr:ATP synthase subunit C [Aigarchaeota archaeon]
MKTGLGRILSMFLTFLVMFSGSLYPAIAAEQNAVTPMAEVESIRFITMALSVGVCSIAAGYAVARISVAAIASAAERPELLGRTIIFVGLAEGIAIYGLLVAVLIWIA